MSFKARIQEKKIGYWLGLVACVLALIGLIVFIVYSGQNATTSTWLYVLVIVGILAQIGMFFLKDPLVDFVGMIPPIAYMVGFGESLHTGIGNLVDSLQGIHMFGNSALVGLNYTMAVIFLLASLLALVAAFLPKGKKAEAKA